MRGHRLGGCHDGWCYSVVERWQRVTLFSNAVQRYYIFLTYANFSVKKLFLWCVFLTFAKCGLQIGGETALMACARVCCACMCARVPLM